MIAAVIVIAAATLSVGQGTYELEWTTDISYVEQLSSSGRPTMFGSDGPWQAAVVRVGPEDSKQDRGPFYPCGSGVTYVLSPSSNGTYSKDDSPTAKDPQISAGRADDGLASIFQNSSSSGPLVYDLVRFNDEFPNAVSVNTTLFQADNWTIPLPSGANYTPSVGILGLGPSESAQSGREQGPSSMLSQLKSSDTIASESFGLHIGSAFLNQSGSLIFGGYDISRALGPVGVLQLDLGLPDAFLLDISIGVEEGGSPFNQSTINNLFQGHPVESPASDLERDRGAPAGSIIMMANPAVPYIYLPPGSCEAIAAWLPVSWKSDIEYFVWNTEDPLFERIVKSPSYLAFTFSDSTATNFTIKVPFPLLNLTLEAPIVEMAIQYFPCKPIPGSETYGFWEVGRAFLQAAFVGVNYEQNVGFMAQAPDPDMDQSVTKTLQPGDKIFDTNPIDSFAKSWRNHWTVLPDSSDSGGSTVGTINSSTSQPFGLPAGAIAGIVIGVVALIAIIAGAFLWYRRKRKSVEPQVQEQAQPIYPLEMDDTRLTLKAKPGEVYGSHGVSELGRPLPHEAPGSGMVHEVLSGPVSCELPAQSRNSAG